MKYLFWAHLGKEITKFGFYLTAFSSTLFIILTLFYVKEKIGSYRYLLLLLPITGFLLASFEYMLDLFFHCYNHALVHFRFTSFQSLSYEVNTSFLSLFPGLYGATISTLALQFVYRYWLIFQPHNIHRFFDGPRFIFPVFYTLFTGATWFSGSILFTRLDSKCVKYLEKEILNCYGLVIAEQPALAFVAYDNNGDLRWESLVGMGSMSSSMTFQYAIIIYCACIMGLKMQEKIAMLSSKSQRMHRQFYHALVIQITAPSITLFSPVFLLFFAPYLDIEMSFPGIFMSASACYPAMDILIMIYMATFYKNALIDFLKTVLLMNRGTTQKIKSVIQRYQETQMNTVTTRATRPDN
ncbi:hypothetical protein GCK72_004603 [Caenorhabditis remanei]|uniref:Seven TM Receptor n=1 Tax=Caenorhabditis remanei TaxID=31234 RepID=A0A6A5HCS9_CAERE|nr:hypothetical protein GCK72_004603 [Caenorhabditis remanei]KAF1764654.1 hypothetical protein GCK72_004603 [Caenorhabditis remanei]